MGRLKTTRWSSQTAPETVWREYPRPSLARPGWTCLNGLWEYAFTEEEQIPPQWEGQILVPFSPEAPLSGVGRQLKPEEVLWYRKTFLLPEVCPGRGRRVLLHFGAVDQTCTVYVNGKKAGNHTGGYLPFTLDITELCREGEQELLVKVCDLSDTGWHSRGKQKLKAGGMFYTAQSGIWQTVWLETVPEQYIKSVRIRPDYDGSFVKIRPQGTSSFSVAMTVFEDFTDEMLRHFLETGKICGQRRCSLEAGTGREWKLPMEGFSAWTPEHPKLYGLLLEGGEDTVLTYFAIRKCSVQKDGNGISRLYLNGRPYFQTGLLDQGYWPDGLYTAPCDEALMFDIRTAKSIGFNLLRKHVKVEPERWYYHCDRLGMLVWQDMVNGGSAYHSWFVTYLATAASCLCIPVKDTHKRLLSRREKEGRLQFRRELKEMVKTLYNHPSIVTWVPFNEGWGQFETNAVTEELRRLDPSRLVDSASGWFDQGGGDFVSIHSYFFSYSFKKEARAAALTEYGGYCLPVEGHRYSGKTYGYRQFAKPERFFGALGELWEKAVRSRIKEGLSAAVYTQLSDVEEEVNGLLTYDREVLKVPAGEMKALNGRLIGTLAEILPAGRDRAAGDGAGETAFREPQKTAAHGTVVIGGADGPTAVFLAGKRRRHSKEERQRSRKREKNLQRLVPNGRTTEELKKYLIEKYGAETVPEDSGEYGLLYRAMKGNLVIKERPELLTAPEPELPEKALGTRSEKIAMKAYMEAFEQRFKEAEELPDEVIPMRYSLYRFPVLENGERLGEVTVELEDIRQRVGMSYSNFRGQKEPEEICRDIIRYFGVRQEDIETQSERLAMYLYMFGES